MTYLYSILIICGAIQLIYGLIFLKINTIKSKESYLEAKMPLSLIICAKNEIDNLKAHLQNWTKQKYADYEIIIVNDCSTDGSKEWLDNQAAQIQNLQVIHLLEKDKTNLKGKRDALWKGIRAAKYDYLVFTDADCQPLSQNWLQKMANSFSEEKEIVISYSPYEEKKGILNQLIRYETFITAIQYLGFAHIEKPYMGVGRNIAYKKSLFTESVFEKSNQSLSGDDDLVFQQIATKENVAIQIDENSFVESKAPTTWQSWIHQKTRHTQAGNHYPFRIKLLLGIFLITNITPLLLIPYGFFSTTILASIVAIQIGKMLLLSFILRKLKVNICWLYFLYLDIFYWYIFCSYALLSTFANNGWKSKETQ